MKNYFEHSEVSIIPYIFGVPEPGQAQKCKTFVARVKKLTVVSLQSKKKYDHLLKEYPSRASQPICALDRFFVCNIMDYN